MQYKYLRHNKLHDRLILFVNGWGIDERPFLFLQTTEQADVVVVYDYDSFNLEPGFYQLVKSYSKIDVIAWSFGVWYFNHIAEMTDKWNQIIYVNGTLTPIDRQKGIPPAIFRLTLSGLDENSLLKFYRNMFISERDYDRFMKNKPRLPFARIRAQLQWFEGAVINSSGASGITPNAIIIGQKDRIFPVNNLHQAWSQSENIIVENTGHFPFYHWNSWEEIIDVANNQ
ncbi:MAG: DUF452 family protein [Calditrichia bacterium]